MCHKQCCQLAIVPFSCNVIVFLLCKISQGLSQSQLQQLLLSLLNLSQLSQSVSGVGSAQATDDTMRTVAIVDKELDKLYSSYLILIVNYY